MMKTETSQAVVVIASQMCSKLDDERVWRQNVQQLMDLTGKHDS